jgi:hypothetical protein
VYGIHAISFLQVCLLKFQMHFSSFPYSHRSGGCFHIFIVSIMFLRLFRQPGEAAKHKHFCGFPHYLYNRQAQIALEADAPLKQPTIRAICPAHLILLDFIIRINFWLKIKVMKPILIHFQPSSTAISWA